MDLEDKVEESESIISSSHIAIRTSSDEQNQEELEGERLKYNVEDYPPLHVNLMLAFQLVVSTIIGPVTMVYMVRSAICAGHDNLVFAELMSTSLFLMGVCTFMQVTFGTRLPIIQGSCLTFLLPILAMMQTSRWKCPPTCSNENESSLSNQTTAAGEAEVVCDDEAWRPRLLEISGGLICASLVHSALGLSGLVGVLQKYIGPLTIVPAVALVGLALFPVATESSQHHWGIAAATLAFYALCVLQLSRYNVPLPAWTSEKSFHFVGFPLFRVFSVLLSVIFGWLLCLIFTVTGSLATNPDHVTYAARVDARIDAIYSTKWIFVPYPGYWGTPTVSAGIVVGMLSAVLQSIIESIGDYYATASVCNVPAPPKHAINRGIAIEGLGSLLSGMLGSCHATTSYSTVVGIVATTGVASRFTFQLVSALFIICGLFGKFGGALAMCPDPVIGAILIQGLGLTTAVGLSAFRHCDMTSTRNMAILGLSLMLGLMCPFYLADHPEIINTGSPTLDQVLIVFLSTGMLVGAVIGFVLDNIVPGTQKERGLLALNSSYHKANASKEAATTYNLPYMSHWLASSAICSYMPFLPGYTERACLPTCRKKSSERCNGAAGRDINVKKETQPLNGVSNGISMPLNRFNECVLVK